MARQGKKTQEKKRQTTQEKKRQTQHRTRHHKT